MLANDRRTGHLTLALALAASLLPSAAARAGNIFLTGHDVLLHEGQAGYDQVVLDYLRNGDEPASTYTISVIGSGAGHWNFSNSSATPPGGYPTATYYDTSNLDGDTALQAQALSADVLIVLSHTSCGGCDLTTEGSQIINEQMSQGIFQRFEEGMDLWLNAAGSLPTYYDMLPPSMATGSEPISGDMFCATSAGAAIGITPSHTTGFPTHNSFDDFSPVLTVLETDCGSGTTPISLGALDVSLCSVRIDFEDLAHADGLEALHGSSYSQGDFEIHVDATASRELSTYGSSHPKFSGSTAIKTTGSGSPWVTLHNGAGAPFTLWALSLAKADTLAPASVDVVYHDSSVAFGPLGGQTFSLTGGDYLASSFIAGGFEKVSAIVWDATDVQLDDVCIAEVGAPCAPLPSGAIAWWAGQNCEPRDRVGGWHATMQNPAPCPADPRVGPAALGFSAGQGTHFTRSGHAALLPGEDGYTIDAWIRADSTAGSRPIVEMSPPYALSLENGVPRLVFCGDSACGILDGPAALDGDWHHLAATIAFFDGGSVCAEIFVDAGSVANTCVQGGDPWTTPVPLAVGGSPAASPTQFFDGAMDEIELFHAVLTPGEIQAIVDADSTGKCIAPKVEVDDTNGSGFPIEDVLIDFEFDPYGTVTRVYEPPPGGDPEQVVDFLAAAINGDGLLREHGVFAIADGSRLLVFNAVVVGVSSGATNFTFDVVHVEADETPSPQAIPAASDRQLSGLALLLALLGAVAAAGRARNVRTHHGPARRPAARVRARPRGTRRDA